MLLSLTLSMRSGINIEIHSDKEILVIDFSGNKEDEMIEMMIEFRDIIIAGKKPILILGIFNDKNYLTPKFMQAFRKVKRDEVTPYILRQAVVGLSENKKIILKGFNLFFNRNIQPFDSKELAIRYLISE